MHTLKPHIALMIALSSFDTYAHSGRTNADGCHTNSKTGDYHCHGTTAPVVLAPKLPTTAVEPDKPTPVVTTPKIQPIITPTTTTVLNKPKPIVIPAIIEQPKTTGIVQLDYDGFTIWLDCDKHAATKFKYTAQYDDGNYSRDSFNFSLDEELAPMDCQQSSSLGYGHSYDRGHLVPANHLDYSKSAIKQSFYMTNILPQAANMNRGAWLATEELIECYRDIDDLTIIGGVIFGNNKKDDYFVKSHDVVTPDSFWKVVIRSDGETIAWNVPNSSAAIRSKLDSYLVTVAQIETLTGEVIPVSTSEKTKKLTKSWSIPTSCDKS